MPSCTYLYSFTSIKIFSSDDFLLIDASLGLQKKEVICNAVGKLCATITNALSKFMHEVSRLENGSGEETSRDSRPTLLGGKNVEKKSDQRDEDTLPEDSSELPTDDTEDDQRDEDTLPEDSSELPTDDTEDTDECGDGSSVDGGSTDDSEDDPDWEEHFNCSRQKHGKTEHGNRPSKIKHDTGEGSGHDSGAPKDNQQTGNQCTEAQANIAKRASPVVSGYASHERSKRQKNIVSVEKKVVQPTTKPLHVGGRPSSSTLVLCSDTRPLKVEEDME
jgi:hypothetical protein